MNRLPFRYAIASLLYPLCPIQAAPPQPTVLTVEYKKQMLPVIRVVKSDPVVLVDGKEKRLRTDTRFLTQLAPVFGEGEVTISDVSLGGAGMYVGGSQSDAQTGPTSAKGGALSGTSFFSAKFRAASEIKSGFVVILYYSPRFFAGAEPAATSPQLVVQSLPRLPAGDVVTVSFSTPLPTLDKDLAYAVQVYNDEGQEILTNVSPAAWTFYELRNRAKLQQAIQHYVQKQAGTDHAVTPISMPRPLVPKGATLPTETVQARLSVSERGWVTRVDVQTPIEASQLRQNLIEALEGWLFLPRLRAGQPVASEVQVPIKF